MNNFMKKLIDVSLKSLIALSFFQIFNSYVFPMSNTMGGGGLSFGGMTGYAIFGEFDGHYDLKTKERKRYFIGLGSTTMGDRSDKNTYDFNEDLFWDRDLGKQTEYTYIVGGISLKTNVKQSIYLGGGFTSGQTFFKREDDTEILGSEGIYFVEDGDGSTYSPTGTIGIMLNTVPNQFKIRKYGFVLNVSPSMINGNILVLW